MNALTITDTTVTDDVNDAPEAKPLLIGLGNQQRGDDQLGLYVARCLHNKWPMETDLLLHCNDPAYLLDQWSDRDLVIVVDAIQSLEQALGTLFSWNGLDDELAVTVTQASTHSLGLKDAIALGNVLNKLPAKLWIHGVNVESFGLGEQMSPVTQASAEQLIELLDQKIHHYFGDATHA